MIIDRKKYRTPIILLAIGLVFCIVSAIIATSTTGEWFARSGAVLSFVSVVVQFFLSSLKRSELEQLFKTDLGLREKFNVAREKDFLADIVSTASIITGLIGTIIWGYGDLFYRY